MFKLVLVSTFVASALAGVFEIPHAHRPAPARHLPISPVPINAGPHAEILRQSQDIQPDGYQWSYQTSNGIAAEESAQIHPISEHEAQKSAHGQYSYTSPEGEHVVLSYVADENGFQPQGSHIPVAPPIPEAIQRALKFIAAHPEPAQPQRVFANRRY